MKKLPALVTMTWWDQWKSRFNPSLCPEDFYLIETYHAPQRQDPGISHTTGLIACMAMALAIKERFSSHCPAKPAQTGVDRRTALGHNSAQPLNMYSGYVIDSNTQ
ncbi:MAG: hypothetical protein ACR2O0_15650 [Rhizobiaceae bacterium]